MMLQLSCKMFDITIYSIARGIGNPISALFDEHYFIWYILHVHPG